MKNSIIFYSVLLLCVFGGIKWTSYSLRGKTKDRIAKTNYNEVIGGLYMRAGEVAGAEFKGRDVVIYSWNTRMDSCLEEIKKLGILQQNHPELLILLNSMQAKEEVQAFLAAKKITSEITIVHYPEGFNVFVYPVQKLFYRKDKVLNTLENPESIVITKDGKVPYYNRGLNKNLANDIETALK